MGTRQSIKPRDTVEVGSDDPRPRSR
jgi:hypothetical protein